MRRLDHLADEIAGEMRVLPVQRQIRRIESGDTADVRHNRSRTEIRDRSGDVLRRMPNIDETKIGLDDPEGRPPPGLAIEHRWRNVGRSFRENPFAGYIRAGHIRSKGRRGRRCRACLFLSPARDGNRPLPRSH
ncbi:hypothetical protein [Sphingomonas profundi]|uniref:hypothetical protein n=1 Tax=Alterirhizorhabdus profundi TaxID=2681549 RepID=UPI001E5F2A05|nr:hypothetical protein [Sphingomonas profundi]